MTSSVIFYTFTEDGVFSEAEHGFGDGACLSPQTVSRLRIKIVFSLKVGLHLGVLLINIPEPWLAVMFEYSLLFSFLLANYRLPSEVPAFCRDGEKQV